MRKLFWMLLGLLAGAALHIVYVLYFPSFVLNRQISSLVGGNGNNQMVLLSADRPQQVLPGFVGESVIALCRVDLSKGKVALSLTVPDGYWSLAIYSQSGRQVYALNDKQAGADTFTIVMEQARSLIEQVTSAGDNEDVVDTIAKAAWSVEINEPRGVVVLWSPLVNPLLRPQLEAVMKNSSCLPIKT